MSPNAPYPAGLRKVVGHTIEADRYHTAQRSSRCSGVHSHSPWRNLTYVLVHTGEGLNRGRRTRMLGHTDALLGYLREAADNHILGSDPFAVEDLVRRRKYGDYGRAGDIVMSGIACVETACWDINGKRSAYRSGRAGAAGRVAARHSESR
ncbi:hypothetical protein AB0M34_25695 [Nocardia sp. NPDC050193]